MSATDQEIELLKEYGVYERHFNSMQNTYRQFASGWLVAALGAMGYVLLQDDVSGVGLSRTGIAGLIAVATTVGLLLLWFMDAWIYHRLLLSCFDVADDLEQKAGLPRLRDAMAHALKRGSTVSKAIHVYYLVPAGLLLAVAAWCWQV